MTEAMRTGVDDPRTPSGPKLFDEVRDVSMHQ